MGHTSVSVDLHCQLTLFFISMSEASSPGTVRDEGSNVLVYSDTVRRIIWTMRRGGESPDLRFGRPKICISAQPSTADGILHRGNDRESRHDYAGASAFSAHV